MAKYSKDRAFRSITCGPAIAAGLPFENSGTTPKNPGTATGAGDEFGYVPGGNAGPQFPQGLSWDVSVAGGVLSALVVNLEGSNDNFVTAFTIDTQNTVGGGLKVLPSSGGGGVPYRYYRGNIATYTVSSGTPVVTVGITL